MVYLGDNFDREVPDDATLIIEYDPESNETTFEVCGDNYEVYIEEGNSFDTVE